VGCETAVFDDAVVETQQREIIIKYLISFSLSLLLLAGCGMAITEEPVVEAQSRPASGSLPADELDMPTFIQAVIAAALAAEDCKQGENSPVSCSDAIAERPLFLAAVNDLVTEVNEENSLDSGISAIEYPCQWRELDRLVDELNNPPTPVEDVRAGWWLDIPEVTGGGRRKEDGKLFCSTDVTFGYNTGGSLNNNGRCLYCIGKLGTTIDQDFDFYDSYMTLTAGYEYIRYGNVINLAAKYDSRSNEFTGTISIGWSLTEN
jgi:hypothetical protein